MKIAEIAGSERPRERLARLGPEALSDEELVALVLRTGYAGRSALEVARDVLVQRPARELIRMTPAALGRFKGIGPGRACALAAGVELARRWDGRAECAERLEGPRQVWDRLRGLRGKRKEHFVALYVNARNRLLHVETVSVGTLTASLVHPREVFGPAVERAAAGIIVAHNHPSGELQPSSEDRSTTRRLVQAGRLLGVPLLDHVVVADGGYFSFQEHGML